MNAAAKIKPGYRFVLQDASLVGDTAPPRIYNVPNPPSDVAENVTREEVRDAITTHRKTLTKQLDESGLNPD